MRQRDGMAVADALGKSVIPTARIAHLASKFVESLPVEIEPAPSAPQLAEARLDSR